MKDAKVWLKYVQKRNEKLILCCTYLIKGLTQIRSITTNSHRHFHYNTTLLNYFSIILLWFSKVKKNIIKFKHFWIYLCTYLASHIYLDVDYFEILKKILIWNQSQNCVCIFDFQNLLMIVLLKNIEIYYIDILS